MEKLTRKEAFTLSMDAYFKKSSVTEYSADERVEGFKTYLNDLNKDFRNNKNEIFQIIEDTVNEILPQKVMDYVRNFAEFKNFDNNTQVRFKISKGKIKAVNVAVGGTVQRQRLDKGYFTVKTEAIQCKVFEEYERVLGGLVDWNILVNAVADAIMDAIVVKIYAGFIDIYNKVPAVNSHSATSLDKVEFDKILNIVKSYGKPIIMGTPRALATLTVDATFATDEDKADLRTKGYLGMYRGADVIEIPNAVEDETNAKFVLDDQYIFIFPVGTDVKPVKVAMEGGLITREANAQDWTWNFEAYQKVGVSVPVVNHIGVYKNTSLV